MSAIGDIDIERVASIGWVALPGLYEPSAWQREFHSCKVDYLLGAGAAGPGKTQTLLFDPMAQIAVEHHRCRSGWMRWGQSTGKALHLRRELVRLEETIGRARRFFPTIDPQVAMREEHGRFTCTFASGFKYIFGGCKDVTDWAQYTTSEYTGIYYDEVIEFEKEQFDQINKRLRSTDPILGRMLRRCAATNPAPGWVRDFFVDPAPEGRVVRKIRFADDDGTIYYRTRMFLPATIDDNPNKEFVRQYKRELRDSPPHIVQALLYGNWFFQAGAFFAEEWNPNFHVMSEFRTPPEWSYFRSMDWGYKTAGVVHWWVVTPDQDMICIEELYFRKLTAGEVADKIRIIEMKLGLWKGGDRGRSTITGPADTQLWEERGSTAPSKAEEMAQKGVYWTKADKKSRQNNAERLLARLKDQSGEYPGIGFFPRCRMAIQQIPTIKVDPDDSSVPLKGGEDHAYDSVSYACASRTKTNVQAGARRVAARSRDRDDRDDDEKDRYADNESPRKSRWGYGYG